MIASIIGGMPVGPDGRIHTTFTRDASTLRLTSKGPNLTNIPRGGPLGGLVKKMFVAPKGYTFWKRDYSGIEARLVGLAAASKDYFWISGIDVHSYFTAYKLYELDHKLKWEDVPQLTWSEADIRLALKAIKKRFPHDRQALKHVGHMGNYMGGASKAQEVLLKELGICFPVKDIQKMMDVYYAIFPAIPIWHRTFCLQVDAMKKQPDDRGMTGVCYVKNPFGFIMRFHNVLDWTRVELPGGGHEWTWEYGRDAKAVVASWPQSTAAFIYCEAAMKIRERYPEVYETFRLMIHDEIFGEARREEVEHCLAISKLVMEEPIPEIPLDPSWGMGDRLIVYTEGKVGPCWAEMEDVP